MLGRVLSALRQQLQNRSCLPKCLHAEERQGFLSRPVLRRRPHPDRLKFGLLAT